MKVNAIIRIIVWSLVLCISLVVFFSLLDLERGIPTTEIMEVTPSVEELRELGVTQKLEIYWTSGTVTIQPGDVYTITVEESPVSDERYAMVVEEEDGCRIIRYQKDSASLSIGKSLKKDLTVTVPKNWNGKSLKVELTSADMIVRDVSISQVSVSSVSGESTFENCTVEELQLNSDSGSLNFSGRLGKLEIDSESANVTADLLNAPESVDLISTSGSLLLTLPQDAGFTADLGGNCTFSTDFETTQEKLEFLCGDGSCKIKANTSGSVDIRKGET